MTIALRCPATRQVYNFNSHADVPDGYIFERVGKVIPFDVNIDGVPYLVFEENEEAAKLNAIKLHKHDATKIKVTRVVGR